MTDRRHRSRDPRDVLRDRTGLSLGPGMDTGSETDDTLSAGLGGVAAHARQLARGAVHEGTARLGRERLLAAAHLQTLQSRSVASTIRTSGTSALTQLTKLTHFANLWTQLQQQALRSPRVSLALVLVALVSSGYILSQRGAPGLATASAGVVLRDPPQAPEPARQNAQPEPTLTYAAVGGRSSASNYLVAEADEPAHLQFSDGTKVTAAPGSRLRVDSTHSRGARVLLEQGVARANVTHSDDTQWVFVAGPFDVRITGTRFTLRWDATEQVLDLELHEGSVEVDSSLGANGIKVKTGQRFHASVAEGTMQLLAADSASPIPLGEPGELDARDARRLRGSRSARARLAKHANKHAKQLQREQRQRRGQRQGQGEASQGRQPRALEASHDIDDSAGGDPATAPGPIGTDEPTSYQDLIRAGAFERVIAAATKAGLGKTLQRNDADDVRALADAARYLHRTELAVRSLTVLRTRFPGTHHSAAAAFLLGRTYENAEQLAAAKRFYELYERETPRGELAAEALAGRMRTVEALEGAAQARAIAQQYLRRYPKGVNASTAHQLMSR